MYKLTIVYKNRKKYTIEHRDHYSLIDIAENIVHDAEGAIGYKITKNNTVLNLMIFNKENLTKIVNA
jgi:hypothetical protein